MKIRPEIKIGGITYKVVFTDLEDLGKTDFTKSTIYIDEKLPLDQKLATFLHEVYHCINSQLSEKDVEFLAQATFQIIKDNE